MPTPSSGPISFLNLRDTFGVSPTPINQLYRAGANVPDITNNNAIPTSGIVSLNEYYSTWGNKTVTLTVTVGSITGGKTGTRYGFGPGFGSISSNSILTPNGAITIEGLYYSSGNATWHLQLANSGSAPVDTDLSFKQVSVTGYSVNGVRSARTNTYVIGNSRNWAWQVTNTAHPTSGTVTCSIQYYG
jgi:hypothetical protein